MEGRRDGSTSSTGISVVYLVVHLSLLSCFNLQSQLTLQYFLDPLSVGKLCLVLEMGTRKEPIAISSLGRVQGAKLNRDTNASQESLASHPLLSPPPTLSVSTSPSASPQPESNATGRPTSPKYVPYTPRHRVSTSQVTAQSSPPSLGGITGGGATPQLQLQNLKAAAQNAQLTAGSVGWAICEKLFQEGEGPEWEDIWTAVVTNKVIIDIY